MKTTVLSILLGLIFSPFLFAQKYSCESSRIGKLITKPLMENGTVNYDKALTDTKDKRNNNPDGVGITKDTLNSTYVTRWHMIGNSSLNLLFVSHAGGKICTYQITEISDKKSIRAFRLNGEGQVIDWDAKEHLSDAEKQREQKQADAWLKYFEN